MNRCPNCGSYLEWNLDYKYDMFYYYYFCPICKYDSRNIQYTCSDHTEPYKVERKCSTCKHYLPGEFDGSCGSYICKGYSGWEGGRE